MAVAVLLAPCEQKVAPRSPPWITVATTVPLSMRPLLVPRSLDNNLQGSIERGMLTDGIEVNFPRNS